MDTEIVTESLSTNHTPDQCISTKPEADVPMESEQCGQSYVFASSASSSGIQNASAAPQNLSRPTELKRPSSVPYSASTDHPLPFRRKRCNSGSSLSLMSKRPAITTLFEVGSSMVEIPRPPSTRIECPSGADNTSRQPPPVPESTVLPVPDPKPTEVTEHVMNSSPSIIVKTAPPDTPVKISNPNDSNSLPNKTAQQSMIRITFTAIDYDSRLSLIELCQQLPDCEIVEKAQDATHLICTRLLRTPKTYLALAVGCYLVTPKWIQASVLRGCWLGKYCSYVSVLSVFSE